MSRSHVLFIAGPLRPSRRLAGIDGDEKVVVAEDVGDDLSERSGRLHPEPTESGEDVRGSVVMKARRVLHGLGQRRQPVSYSASITLNDIEFGTNIVDEYPKQQVIVRVLRLP